MKTVTLNMIHRDLEFVKGWLMKTRRRMANTDRIIMEGDNNSTFGET